MLSHFHGVSLVNAPKNANSMASQYVNRAPWMWRTLFWCFWHWLAFLEWTHWTLLLTWLEYTQRLCAQTQLLWIEFSSPSGFLLCRQKDKVTGNSLGQLYAAPELLALWPEREESIPRALLNSARASLCSLKTLSFNWQLARSRLGKSLQRSSPSAPIFQ